MKKKTIEERGKERKKKESSLQRLIKLFPWPTLLYIKVGGKEKKKLHQELEGLLRHSKDKKVLRFGLEENWLFVIPVTSSRAGCLLY
jgi:hypothetical protein